MELAIISLGAGLIFIFFSADYFIETSAKIANIYKVKPLIIGILILGFGTSAPEMFVSGLAALEEHPGLSVGNAFGSNIFNIALVLGITAILKPIKLELKNIRFELVILIVFTAIAGLLLLHNSNLSNFDGFVLLVLLGVFLWYTFKESKKVHHEVNIPSLNEGSEQKLKLWRDLVWWLFVLIVCAQLIVYGATNIATEFGVDDVIIGITIVALGTSLPELAVSITGVYRNQHEMVVGNIIGSNIFNTVAVLAIPALISTSDVSLISTSDVLGIWPTYSAFFLDFGFMFVLTIAIGFFLLVSGSEKRKHQISSTEGSLLVLVLCIYLLQMFISF
jgi:cation:H+ antiporter|tara:strand:+ start:109 stop:1110 length:1002 start_codon:yes stop_codon:yes gene_type:complete